MNGGAGFALPMVMGESSFPMYGRGSSPKGAGPVFFMPSKNHKGSFFDEF